MPTEKTSCPTHGPMMQQDTRHGPLWLCEHPGCTVRCWGGSTSYPADQETRAARHRLHELFDPLWKIADGPFSRGHRPNKPGVRRDRAYRWLASVMQIEQDDAHFGMFTLEQCERAAMLIGKLTPARNLYYGKTR